jgi:hypothetical protein
MKSIKQYLKEELFTTPMNTIGIGNIQAPTENICGSGDIPQPMCIDIKTGKLYKRRKKFRRYKII